MRLAGLAEISADAMERDRASGRRADAGRHRGDGYSLPSLRKYPIYAFLRSFGPSPTTRRIAPRLFEYVIENQVFAKARQEKGPLRSFLLASLKNFIRHTPPIGAQSGRRRAHVSLDDETIEERYLQKNEPAEADTPETLFELSWIARSLPRRRPAWKKITPRPKSGNSSPDLRALSATRSSRRQLCGDRSGAWQKEDAIKRRQRLLSVFKNRPRPCRPRPSRTRLT